MGDSDTFFGQAKLHLYTVKCSHKIWIWRNDLELFFEQIEKAHRTLRGKFRLESQKPGFSMAGAMTAKGQVRINVKMGYPLRNHPDYNEWYVEAAFNCGPDSLKSVLEAGNDLG